MPKNEGVASSHPANYDAEGGFRTADGGGGFGNNEAFGSSFSDKAIRSRFVRKVYLILLAQLGFTVGVMALVILTPSIKTLWCDGMILDEFGIPQCRSISTAGFATYMSSYVVFLVTYLAVVCCQCTRRKFPLNLIVLCLLTAALTLLVTSIAVYHSVWWVMMAIGMTALLCLGLSLFACQTKFDFTGWGPYLFAAIWVVALFGIFAIIFSVKSWPILNLVYSAVIAVLYSFLLIYYTQLIIGGKKYEMSPEDHIIAAVQLYIIIVEIFLALLNLKR